MNKQIIWGLGVAGLVVLITALFSYGDWAQFLTGPKAKPRTYYSQSLKLTVTCPTWETQAIGGTTESGGWTQTYSLDAGLYSYTGTSRSGQKWVDNNAKYRFCLNANSDIGDSYCPSDLVYDPENLCNPMPTPPPDGTVKTADDPDSYYHVN